MENKGNIKGQGQGVHVHVMTIYSGVSSIAVHILNFGITWNCQVQDPAALQPEKKKVNMYHPSLRMKVPDHVYVFGSLLLQ
jgi:hypothetical protein